MDSGVVRSLPLSCTLLTDLRMSAFQWDSSNVRGLRATFYTAMGACSWHAVVTQLLHSSDAAVPSVSACGMLPVFCHLFGYFAATDRDLNNTLNVAIGTLGAMAHDHFHLPGILQAHIQLIDAQGCADAQIDSGPGALPQGSAPGSSSFWERLSRGGGRTAAADITV
eukprot:6201575-Pleurochrysis_carterae.AAC.5